MSIARDNQSVQYDDRSNTQRLEDRIYTLELKVHQTEMESMYENELMANSYLSPAHKVLLRTIRQIISALRVDVTTPTVMHLAELSNKTALSPAQIRRLLTEMDTWGLITKDTRQWREGKQWRSEMTIALGGEIKYSLRDITTEKKAHGGPRKQKCHNCGSENVEPIVYQCLDCGHHGPFDV